MMMEEEICVNVQKESSFRKRPACPWAMHGLPMNGVHNETNLPKLLKIHNVASSKHKSRFLQVLELIPLCRDYIYHARPWMFHMRPNSHSLVSPSLGSLAANEAYGPIQTCSSTMAGVSLVSPVSFLNAKPRTSIFLFDTVELNIEDTNRFFW